MPCCGVVLLRRYLDAAEDPYNPLRGEHQRYTDYISMREDVLCKQEDVDLKAPIIICEIYGPFMAAVLGAIRAVAVSASAFSVHSYQVCACVCWGVGGWEGVGGQRSPGVALQPLAGGDECVAIAACSTSLFATDYVCLLLVWCSPAGARSPTVVLLTSCWGPATRARGRRSCMHR